MKVTKAYGALAPRIPFWTFATEICGISQTDSKVQLTTAQRAIWKSYDRQAGLDGDENEAYRELTGLEPWKVGEKAPPFMQLVLSRGAGKSLLLATVAVYEAVTNSYIAAPGETVAVVALAPRLKQSKDLFRYAQAHLDRPGLKPFVLRSVQGEISLINGRFLRTQAVDKAGGAARGPTYICALFDESAFLSCDGVVIDAEQWQAILAGARGVGDFHGIMSSTPNGKSGFFWETYDSNSGKDCESWQTFLGPQPLVRPDMDGALLREYKRLDEEAFEREFMCSFDAAGTERFFNPLHIKACIRDNVQSIPPNGPSAQYVAAVDPTGGSHDWMTLSVVERIDDGTVRQCLVRGWDPTINGAPTMSDIAREIVGLVAPYGINTVYGDVFGGAWVSEAFASVGIEYITRGFNGSQKVQRASLLRELSQAGRIELLDEPTQTKELIEYEKKTLKSGKVSVNHPMTKDGSDDFLDSLALATWELVGNDMKLHPPKGLLEDVKGWKKHQSSLYAGGVYKGAHVPVGNGLNASLHDIEERGDAATWLITNALRNSESAIMGPGELAFRAGVPAIQIFCHWGKDVTLQHMWMRYFLSAADENEIANAGNLPGIQAWSDIKRKIAERGKRAVIRFSWTRESVQIGNYIAPTNTVGMQPAFGPWDSPRKEWGLFPEGSKWFKYSAPRAAIDVWDRIFRQAEKERSIMKTNISHNTGTTDFERAI